MYSIFSFILTLIEISAAIVGYAIQSKLIFYNTIVYGSPFFLIQHAFGADSLLNEKNPIYWVFAAYHVIKYVCFIMAQRRDDPNVLRTTAIFLEAAYLSLSAYYLY